MRKAILLFTILGILTSESYAQSSKMSIKAVVSDTAQNVLVSANVMLMQPTDSSLITFGRTDKNGVFEFKNVKRQKYLLKVSFYGFLPLQETITPENEGDIDLGYLKMKELNHDLLEVVIKAAKAPLSIRGDTVEYNANSFKVPPGSSVEELLRRLPGMEVDQEGNIKAQGQEVQRVTVDGKRFFGDDPKAATKNLPAEAISKVQVFDGKSEQSKITGINDGKREKTVNLELKDSHKKGSFGKAIVAGGTKERIAGKATYNRFDDKNQFSFIGYGNNTNESGLSWSDYQNFKGARSNDWGEDGNFGFSGGGIHYINGDNSDERLTIGPGVGYTNRGFSKNWGLGSNYNFDDKKTSFNTSYFYNQSDLNLTTHNLRKNFLNTGFFENSDNNITNRFTGNHRGSLRYENKIDSANTFVFLTNMRIGNGTTAYSSDQEFTKNNELISNISNANHLNSSHTFGMANTAIYSHKFKKKGRIFSLSAGFYTNNSDSDAKQNSINKFYSQPNSPPDSILYINQHNGTTNKNNQIRSSAQFIEPIGKYFSFETFANISYKTGTVDRAVNDISDTEETRNNFLSRYYTNDITYGRLGSSFRYSFKGLNIMTGVAVQDLTIKGRFSHDKNGVEIGNVHRATTSFIPAFSLFYRMKGNKYLDIAYNKNINEPSVNQLQPVIDNSNPLYITQGNPDLKPTISNNFDVYFNIYNPGTFSNLYVGLGYNLTSQQIVQSQIIDENLVTTFKPINIDNGRSFNTFAGYSHPIIKTKLNFGVQGSYNYSTSPTPINGVLNNTTTSSFNIGPRLDLTLGDRLSIYANTSWSVADTEYSISSSQNQKVLNSRYFAQITAKTVMDIFVNGNVNYAIYENKNMNFNQKVPILNLSVYKSFLKSKKMEIRVSAIDVFNKNQGISVFASQNFSQTSRTNTLARYFMLSLTYNMRGISNSVRNR